MLVALIAAVAMILQDIVGTIQMQLEASSLDLPVRRSWRDYIGGGWRAWGSALLDQVGWMVALTSTFISIDALQGHNFNEKVLVVTAVSIANIVGTRAGQEMGIALLRKRNKKFETVGSRLERLEDHVGITKETL